MKQRLANILLLIIAVSGWVTFVIQRNMQSGSKTQAANVNVSNTNINAFASWGTDQDLVLQGTEGAKNKYVSQHYRFTWTIDKAFTFIHFPSTAPAVYASRFDRPNGTMALKKNRDTLIGFNPKPSDEITLEVWPNTEEAQSPYPDPLERWSDIVGGHRTVLDRQLVTIGANKFFRAVEMDGEAGSYGYYYYLFSKDVIIVVGSTDISDQDMRQYLAGLSFKPF